MVDILLSVLVWIGIVASFLLGLLVILRNPKALANQLLTAMAVSNSIWAAGLYFFAHPIFISSYNWLKIVYFLVILLVGSAFFFSLVFPKRSTKSLVSAILAFTIPAIFFTFIIFNSDLFLVDVIKEAWGPRQILGPIYPYFGLWTLILTAWMLFNFYSNYRRGQGIEKLQVLYIFLGISIFTIFTVTLDIIYPLLLRNSRYIWLSTLGCVFYLACAVYAVVRHRLMDIRLVVARSAAYALLVVILGLFYAAGLFFIGSFITKEVTTGVNLAISTGLAVIMAFTFQPLRRLLERTTEKIFYKAYYNTDELLEEVSRFTASTLDLDDLTSGLIEILQTRIHVSKAAFFVIKKENGVEGVYRDHGKSYLYPTTEELLELREQKKIVVFEELPEGEIKDIMRRTEVSVFIPLMTEEKLVGFLFLGGKASGDIYFDQDINALEIMSSGFAVALSNAIAYREIQEFSRTLEKKVQERTAQLKETQKRELAKADELLRLKDEFVFIATHDLKTPVTAIDGFVKLIEMTKEQFSSETKDSFEAIKEASDRLKQLVNDLLEVARSESGTIKVEVKPVNINELISCLVKEVEPFASEKKVAVSAKLGKEESMVMADEAKLSEVIENLLSNAVKFNRPQGKVTITTKKLGSQLQVRVADTGYGIPKAEQAKIFQKFFRYRGEETKSVPGTGLGLFVVRMLVEKMEGKVTFVSEEDKGTTFTLTLRMVK